MHTRRRRADRARASARSCSPRPSCSTAATHPVYWIYGFKRGAFWPFIPTGEGQNRDNATELELKAKLERELPDRAGPDPLAGALRRADLTLLDVQVRA